MSGLIALAMFGSVSSMTAVGPRIYFAMARDGVAPRFMGRVSEHGNVPVAAIAAQGLLAAGPEVFRTPLHPLPALVFLGITVAAWGNGLAAAPLPTGAALLILAAGGGIYAVGRNRGWFGPAAGQDPAIRSD